MERAILSHLVNSHRFYTMKWQFDMYLLVVTLLMVSALACGYTRRTCYAGSFLLPDHDPSPGHPRQPGSAAAHPDDDHPSYEEEEWGIRTTMLSAALQEYPDNRVVLLIDDPYVPNNRKAREQLEAARALLGEIQDLLAASAGR